MKTKNRLIGIGILTLTVILLLNAGTLTAQKTEELQMGLVSNTDQCLIDCEAVFKVNAAQDITLSKEDISLWFEKQYGHETDLSDFKIEMLTEKEEYVEVPKTKIVEEALACDGSILADGTTARCIGNNPNDTKSEAKVTLWETEYESYDGKTLTRLKEIPDGTEMKPTTIREYEDYADKKMLAGKDIYFKVTGKRTHARIGPNSVDWKINMLGNQPEWAWWNSNWNKKKRINLSTLVTKYQIELNLTYDSDMQADFDDLRFVNSSENAELNYWIESKVDGNWAKVWVNVTGSYFYVYYANSGASSTANFSRTFIVGIDTFDRADSTTIGNGWTESSGDFSINSNRLKGLGDGTGNDICYKSYSASDTVYVMETRFGYKPETNKAVYLRFKNGSSDRLGWELGSDGKIYYLNNNDYQYSGHTYSTNTWYLLKTIIDTVNHKASYYLDGSLIASNQNYYYSNTNPNQLDMLFYGSSATAYIDYIYVRRYVSPEPTYTVGNEETPNRPPVRVSQELYPVTPNDYDDLTLKVKCTDADAGDTITAYWSCYKDDIKQGTYSSSATVANNTNTTVETIDDADTVVGQEWYCNAYCSDGKANTTTGDTTTRTIQAGCQINANCTICTGWTYLNATESRVLQVRDDDSNGKYDQICCSGTVSEITAL